MVPHFLKLFLCILPSGILSLSTAYGQDTLSSYYEDFQGSVNMDIWRPINTPEHPDGTLAIDVHHDDNLLSIQINQVNFYDGFFFNFTEHENLYFDIYEYPFVCFDVKIEPGATYGGEVVDEVNFTLSPWAHNEAGEFMAQTAPLPPITNPLADGEWHTVFIDLRYSYELASITWPYDYDQDFTAIEAFHLSPSYWPETYIYNMEFDNFKVGNPGIVGTRNLLPKLPLTVFPNPVNDKLIVQSEEGINLIRIFDGQGRLVEVLSYHREQQVELNMNNYPRGMYLIETQGVGKLTTRKIIKH